MRNITFLIIISILIFSCVKKKESASFDYYDEEFIIEFYNEVLDTIVGENLLISQPDPLLTFGTFHSVEEYVNDSLFPIFIPKFYEFRWSNDNIISKDTIDFIFKDKDSFGWKYFRENYGNVCFLNIGLPAFTPDLKTAYVSIDIHCGGLSGHGTNYIFINKNGKWFLKHSEETWKS